MKSTKNGINHNRDQINYKNNNIILWKCFIATFASQLNNRGNRENWIDFFSSSHPKWSPQCTKYSAVLWCQNSIVQRAIEMICRFERACVRARTLSFVSWFIHHIVHITLAFIVTSSKDATTKNITKLDQHSANNKKKNEIKKSQTQIKATPYPRFFISSWVFATQNKIKRCTNKCIKKNYIYNISLIYDFKAEWWNIMKTANFE